MNKKINRLIIFILFLLVILKSFAALSPDVTSFNITATTMSEGKIFIQWTQLSGNGTVKYHLYKKRYFPTDDPTVELIVITGAENNTYTDNRLPDTGTDFIMNTGDEIKYWIEAEDADGLNDNYKLKYATASVDALGPNIKQLTFGPGASYRVNPINMTVEVDIENIDWDYNSNPTISLNWVAGANPAQVFPMAQVQNVGANEYIFRGYMDLSGLADGTVVGYWIMGLDPVGNEITSSTNPAILVDDKIYFTIDNLPPAIDKAVFYDNGDGVVSKNDTIEILFTEAINLTGGVTDPNLIFSLPVSGDTFGVGATLLKVSSNKVDIILGDNPVLTILGTYSSASNTAGSPSGINLKNTAFLVDTAWPTPHNAQEMLVAKDIMTVDEKGPTIVKAFYKDVNHNGIDGSDKLYIEFDQNINVGVLTNQAFSLPVNGDVLLFSSYNVYGNTLELNLSNGTSLKVAGEFNSANTAEGAPSGINISSSMPTGMITNLIGYDAEASNPVDISSTDEVGPKIISAILHDKEKDGPNAGDSIEIIFDDGIYLSSTADPYNSFILQPAGTSFGAGATMQLGTPPTSVIIFLNETTEMIFNNQVGTITQINVNTTTPQIFDISGNAPISNLVNLTTDDNKGPTIISAVFTDLDNNGVDEGDKLLLTFDERIYNTATPISDADFQITNGNLGTGASYSKGLTTIEIILGTGATLELFGTATSQVSFPAVTNFRDSAGNSANGSVYITSSDNVAPHIVKAIFIDDPSNGAIAQGDTIEVQFNEPVKVIVADPNSVFALTSGSNFGVAAVLSQKNATTAVIRLGANPSLNVAGILGVDSTASGIDIKSGQTGLVDISGNYAATNGFVDIEPQEASGPILLKVLFEDTDLNSPDEGDKLYLEFDKEITNTNVANLDSTDFVLHNLNLGSNPTFTVNGNTLEITLGSGATVNQVKDKWPAVGTAAAIGIASGNDITDYLGFSAEATDGVDIEPMDNESPYVVEAKFFDIGVPGINKGDYLLVKFNENITFTTDAAGKATAITVDDFVLPVTGDTLGESTEVEFYREDDQTIKIILGTNPKLTIYGTYNNTTLTAGSPSGISVNSTVNIEDIYGNTVEIADPVSAAVDIASDDTTAPILQEVFYEDTNKNWIIDAGDRLKLVFNEAVVIQDANVTDTDFVLPVTGDTIGSGASLIKDTASAEVVWLVLGTGVKLTVKGIYNSSQTTAGSPSGLDVNTSKITDLAGNGTQQNTVRDVSVIDNEGPKLIGAKYVDNYPTGLSSGDELILYFDEPLILNSPVISDFELPVAGDSFGVAATVNPGINSNEIRIVLGSSANINPSGIFNSANLYSGAPSGIGVLSNDHIQDYWGNSAVHTGYVDIDDGKGPILLSATFEDVINDGKIASGDVLILSFDEPVTWEGQLSATDFVLPVAGDSFGTTFGSSEVTQETKVKITLASDPVLLIEGQFSSSNLSAGSPSGIGVSAATKIRDLVGLNPQTNIVDIDGNDGTRPELLHVYYEDVDMSSTVNAGDKLYFKFSEPIVVKFVSSSYFYMPVSGDYIGDGLNVTVDPASDTIMIVTLTNNSRFNPNGTYSNTSTAAGSPSGIALVDNLPPLTINDIYGNSPIGGVVKDIEIWPYNHAKLQVAKLFDKNGDGATQGDTIELVFDHWVTVDVSADPNTVVTLPVVGDTLGAGAAFYVENLEKTSTVGIVLGNNPVITVGGTFNTANLAPGSPSGIGLVDGQTVIRSLDLTPAVGTPPVDITPPVSSGPVLLEAKIYDWDLNGIDAGDIISLKFNQDITLPSLTVEADLVASLPVALDTFGVGAEARVSTETQYLIITLGNNPVLNPSGEFSSSNLSAGSPSGILIEATSAVKNNYGMSCEVISKDLEDGMPTVLYRVFYIDDGNIGLNEGDKLYIEFNRPVYMTGNPDMVSYYLAFSDATANFGTGAKFEIPATNPTTGIYVRLGANPSFEVAGIYGVDPTATGLNIRDGQTFFLDATTMQPITRYATLDIVMKDSQGPYLVSAGVKDLNNDGILQVGEQVVLEFNEPIVNNGVILTDFVLSDPSASFGTGASISTGDKINELLITLGANPSIEVGTTQVKVSTAYNTGVTRHVLDWAGNDMFDNGYVTIEDKMGPYVVGAYYEALSNKTAYANDILKIKFSEPIKQPVGLTKDAFELPVAGDSLGSYITLDTGLTGAFPTDTIYIRIGPGAVFKVIGEYSESNLTAGSPSGIKLVADYASIEDIFGNKPWPTKAVDIKPMPPAPRLMTVEVFDSNKNGVGENDLVYLYFNKGIDPKTAKITDFTIQAGNFGVGAKVYAGSTTNSVYIRLGAQAYMQDIHNNNATSTKVGLATTNSLYDFSGNSAEVVSVDVKSVTDEVAPSLIGVAYDDTNNDGVVSAGDTITLTFSEAVELAGNLDVADFVLPVAGDSLGDTVNIQWYPTNATQIKVILGNNPVLTPAGLYDSAQVTAGSPSGLSINAIGAAKIVDLAGNTLQVPANALDISVLDNKAPIILNMYTTSSGLGGAKNVILPNGDTIDLYVYTDDESLDVNNFVADFSNVGAGTNINPTSVDKTEKKAVWTGINTGPIADSTEEISVTVTDLSGNVTKKTLEVEIVKAAKQVIAEVNPKNFLRHHFGQSVEISILPIYSSNSRGIDTITITMPVGYSNFSFASSVVRVGDLVYFNDANADRKIIFVGVPADSTEVLITTAGNVITLHFGEPIKEISGSMKNIEFTFKTDTPINQDAPNGQNLLIMVDNTQINSPLQAVEGNANFIATDNNSLNIVNYGLEITDITSKTVIESSAWRVYFYIMFNMNPDPNRLPQLKFKLPNLQTVLPVKVDKLVDKILTAYSVVPFAYAGQFSTFELEISNAYELDGTAMANYTRVFEFPPQVLVKFVPDFLVQNKYIIYLKPLQTSEVKIVSFAPDSSQEVNLPLTKIGEIYKTEFTPKIPGLWRFLIYATNESNVVSINKVEFYVAQDRAEILKANIDGKGVVYPLLDYNLNSRALKIQVPDRVEIESSIYVSDGKFEINSKDFIAKVLDDGRMVPAGYSAKLEKGEKFCLVKDEQAPVIEQVKAGKKIIVRDNFSGIQEFKVLYGKNPVKLKQITDSEFEVKGDNLPIGNVKLTAVAVDRAGNKSEYDFDYRNDGEFDFDLIAYPNPTFNDYVNLKIVRKGLMITKALVNIYTTSGRKVFSKLLYFDNNDEIIYKWDLKNYKGYKVRRGVYFVKVKVFSDTDTKQKFTKVVVLK